MKWVKETKLLPLLILLLFNSCKYLGGVQFYNSVFTPSHNIAQNVSINLGRFSIEMLHPCVKVQIGVYGFMRVYFNWFDALKGLI